MRLQKVLVRHFRALREAELDFSPTTCLLGENNAGKSAFLHALRLFFGSSNSAPLTDFHNDDVSTDIEITVVFSSLTPDDRQRFSGNIIDGLLTVTRTFSILDKSVSGKFYSDAIACPDFVHVRALDKATEKRQAYAELLAQYPELPKATKADDIEPALKEWELSHPDRLERVRLGGFIGFRNVAAGELRKNTDFVFVRAAKEASEIFTEKSSPIDDLLSSIAKQTIQNRNEFREFVDAANNTLLQLTDPDSISELALINEEVSRILQKYYKGSDVETTWDPINELQLKFPTARIAVRDHDYLAEVDRVGHGLQRAVILSILEYMAERQAGGSGDELYSEPQSDIILAIEEPEVFQHPVKQRLFSKVLRSLTNQFSEKTGIRFQTIFVTHCPLFVELPRCDELRVIRRMKDETGYNVVVSRTSLSECASAICEYSGIDRQERWADPVFATKLTAFSSELVEGFFSRCVLLVEGQSDKAILEGWYRMKGRSPLEEGIVVSQADCKTKLDKPAVIFGQLGIPCFVIFDSDHRKAAKKQSAGEIRSNRRLQRCCGVDESDCKDWPDEVGDRFAAFHNNIEQYVRICVGDDMFDRILAECSEQFHVAPSNGTKVSAVASAMMTRFVAAGRQFDRLDEVVARIDKLCEHGA